MNDKKDEQARRIGVIKRISWIGIAGNLLLALMKIVVGFFSSSLAVLADGIDSATDIVTSIVSLLAARVMQLPPDKNHNFGHGRVETLASVSISFIVFFAGLQMLFTAVNRLITGEFYELSNIAIAVTLISIVGKFLLALIKFSAGKKINSNLLIADAKNMRNDVIVSVAVLITLFLVKFTGFVWVDAVAALLISFWIMGVAISIFKESDTELMEGHQNLEDYEKIFTAIATVNEAKNPHKLRIKRMGHMLIIDLDIEVPGDYSVLKGHQISKEVEIAIKGALENVYDVHIHVEPFGNMEEDECYGVSREELEGNDEK